MSNDKTVEVKTSSAKNRPLKFIPLTEREDLHLWDGWQIVKWLGRELLINSYIAKYTFPDKAERFAVVEHISLQEGERDLFDYLIKVYNMMKSFNVFHNIVCYDDTRFISNAYKGFDIIARRELLRPISDRIQNYCNDNVNQVEIIDVGIDICNALNVFHRNNIVHLWVNMDNIFVADTGEYKLGNYVENWPWFLEGSSRCIGYLPYHAPEIYKGDNPSFQADIYSLGLVMYKLLNKGRMPFSPPFPKPFTVSDRNDEMSKIINGDKFPSPQNANRSLTKIILKACANKPQDRWKSAEEMKSALKEELKKHPVDRFRIAIQKSNYNNISAEGISNSYIRKKLYQR